jgi:DNA-binding CsgD family transcriptional regulator
MTPTPETSERGIGPTELKIAAFAMSRMSRRTRLVFLLWSRGRAYDRIAVMMGISRRRVQRHMLKAIMTVDRTAQEIRSKIG